MDFHFVCYDIKNGNKIYMVKIGSFIKVSILFIENFLDGLVEIRFYRLTLVKDFVFVESLFQCLLMRDFSVIFQYLVLPEFKKSINAFFLFIHRKDIFTLNQIFDIIEISRYSPFQLVYLLVAQIIFCNVNIGFQDPAVWSIFPSRKPHVFF